MAATSASASAPQMQILERANYFKQHLVSVPPPSTPLSAPNSIRLRTVALGITVNNFAYAALGSALGWWDVHPLPEGIEAPFDDASTYGRTNAWGYAEVLESTVPDVVPAGRLLWGYVPLADAPQDVEVKGHEDKKITDQLFVTSAWRQNIMPIYNRYFIVEDSEARKREIAQKTEAVALDVLVRIMHATAYLMESFVFSSDPKRVFCGNPNSTPPEWTSEDADLKGATVLIFAPGSKVGLCFAHLLRLRSEDKGRPAAIVGVSSESSRDFVSNTGLYDAVALTSDDPVATLKSSGHEPGSRVVVFDFGGRKGSAGRFAGTIAAADKSSPLLFVGVGVEILDPKTLPGGQVPGSAPPPPPFPTTRVNADDMRTRAIAAVGESEYWAQERESWVRIRESGFPGFSVTWGEGMESVVGGWDRLAKGGVLPSEGLVILCSLCRYRSDGKGDGPQKSKL